MRDHTGGARGFIQLSRAWYGELLLRGSETREELTIGFYSPDGGTTGEFVIRWVSIGLKQTAVLSAYDDAFSALWAFRDVLEKLAYIDGQDRPPADIIAILESCGVQDMTPEKRED